jgi:hypothetical protein
MNALCRTMSFLSLACCAGTASATLRDDPFAFGGSELDVPSGKVGPSYSLFSSPLEPINILTSDHAGGFAPKVNTDVAGRWSFSQGRWSGRLEFLHNSKPVSVPEPDTLVLVALGLGLTRIVRRRQKS